MFEIWEYAGQVAIERLGIREGETMELPVCFTRQSQGGPLSPEEIEAAARELALDFLNMLQATMPAHRDDYGGIVNVDITSMVRQS